MKTATVSTPFASRLYDKLAAEQAGKNLFLSPFSIQVALAMCAAGARGDTRKVMADLIGAPENVEEQNRHYAELIRTVNGEGERPFQPDTANALWGQQGYAFKPDYKKMIADCYNGAFHEVNFKSAVDAAIATINTWVCDKTHEKIKELVSRDVINEYTRLVLTNAIYFKGAWDQEFQKDCTHDEDWHGRTGSRKTPMMHQERNCFYGEGDGYQAVDLPYRGEQLSMLVVLPTRNDGLAVLERKLASEGAYQQVINGLEPDEKVSIALPRFKMETECKLSPVLCEMGAALAFSDDADFTNISPEGLAISEVIHKAFVEVNEEGTEAAAATAVVMRCLVSAPMPPKVFRADHPFLFFIRDRNTSAVLFTGRVLDPR